MKDSIFSLYEHIRNLVKDETLEISIGKAWESKGAKAERLDEAFGGHVRNVFNLSESEHVWKDGNCEKCMPSGKKPVDVNKEKVNKAIEKVKDGDVEDKGNLFKDTKQKAKKEVKESEEVQPYSGNKELPEETDLTNAGPNKKIADTGAIQEKSDQKIKDINKIKKATDQIGINKYSKTKSYINKTHVENKKQKGGLKPGYKIVKESKTNEDFNNNGLQTNSNDKGKEQILGTFSDEKVAQDVARNKKGTVVKDEKENIWRVIVKENIEVFVSEEGEPKAVIDVNTETGEVSAGVIELEAEDVTPNPDNPEADSGEVGLNPPSEEDPIGQAFSVGEEEGPIIDSKVDEGNLETEINDDEQFLNGLKLLNELVASGNMTDARHLLQELNQYLQEKDGNEIEEDFGKKLDIKQVPVQESADDFTVGYAESLKKALKDVLGVSIEDSKIVSKLKSLQRPELELLKKAMESADVEALRHFLNSIIGPKEQVLV